MALYVNERPHLEAGVETLPASYYTDPAHFERELEAIHYDMWLAAGRTEQIPTAGSYFLRRVGRASGLRSMSRTTAFPATIMAGMLLHGHFARAGVHAPETVGAVPGLLDRMLCELERRDVRCQTRIEWLPEQDPEPRAQSVAAWS